MRLSTKNKTITLFLLLAGIISGMAQDTDGTDTIISKKGFHVGLYIGSYFANKYTANMYDGYGFDFDGNKNNFENSFLYQKINMEYGGYGYSGQPDLIAQALQVDYHTWTFDESDMPVNMKYAPAVLVGLNCRYSVDPKNSIILNLNAVKLTINGNFTIITPQQPNSTQVNSRIKTFPIKGGEQRLLFQFGYQRIIGNNEKVNFLVEGGLNATLAKFDKNEILINDLKINLTTYNNTAYYASAPPVKKPIGTGFGIFGSIGANLSLNPKCTVQLLYNPTYEKINMGVYPRLKLQNAVGLRAYYNI